MLNFNQFINESNNDEELATFNSIEVGDIVRHAGSQYTVKEVGHSIIRLPRKVSFHQWKQGAGKIIKKIIKKKEDKDEK